MSTSLLDGKLFLRLVRDGAANLQQHAAIVNDLNVFPIPDGDTGDNMMLTVTGGLKGLSEEDDLSLAEASASLAHGMLLSARGNSGVILSQLFAGLAGGFQGMQKADTSAVCEALRAGVRRAYDAVLHPTEGTILTVAREAAEAVNDHLGEVSTLESLFEYYMAELSASLERTPELLACLKEAGVIDSGGAGLFYLADGARRSLSGEEISPLAELPGAAPATEAVAEGKFDENSVLEFGYCTEFLLQLQTCKVDIAAFSLSELVDWLKERGDSLVAFRTGSIIKVHIHTMTPGEILNYCQRFGEFLTLKIENMTLQHNEATLQNRFSASDTSKKQEKRKPFGVVVVASGEGICETFRSLGADVIIEGGQGNNPSPSEFVAAFDEANADVIYVLPNNGNIMLAARQAAELYAGADVRVIGSHNMGDGYAVMSMLDYTSGDADTIQSLMEEAMEGVLTGFVARSIRDAHLSGLDIHTGAYLGCMDKEALVSNDDKVETALSLLDKMGIARKEICIAIYGRSVSFEEREQFRSRAAQRYPGAELCEIDGKQDIYDFLLVLE